MDRRRFALFAALVVLVAVVPYLNALHGGFVWDDPLLIFDNHYIKDWRHIPNILTENMGAGAPSGRSDLSGFYRPLPLLSLMADYALHGPSPTGYHISNIALHAMTGLAAFLLIQLLFGDAVLALITSLLFVAHPINTEVVAYVSGRDTGLAVLLLLTCCACYVAHLRRPRRVLYAAALSCYVLSLLSKELAVVGPLLLIMCEAVLGSQPRALARRLALFVLVDLAWLAATFTVLSFPEAAVRGKDLPLPQRVAGFFASLPAYARLTVFPRDQHVDYGFVDPGFAQPAVLAGIGIALAGVWFGIVAARRCRAAAFALAWIALNLGIYCGIYPTNAFMAEHWFVVPFLGVCLLAALGTLEFARRHPSSRVPVATALLVTVGVLGTLTARQNRYWSDPEIFYSETIRLAPREHRAEYYYNLGNYRLGHGDTEGALHAWFNALEHNNRDMLSYHNIGVAYERTGRYTAAEEAYRSALRIEPDSVLTCLGLANLYALRGDSSSTSAMLDTVARLEPNDPEIAAAIRKIEGLALRKSAPTTQADP